MLWTCYKSIQSWLYKKHTIPSLTLYKAVKKNSKIIIVCIKAIKSFKTPWLNDFRHFYWAFTINLLILFQSIKMQINIASHVGLNCFDNLTGMSDKIYLIELRREFFTTLMHVFTIFLDNSLKIQEYHENCWNSLNFLELRQKLDEYFNIHEKRYQQNSFSLIYKQKIVFKKQFM